MSATALMVSIGDVWRSPSSRHLVAYRGLNPRVTPVWRRARAPRRRSRGVAGVGGGRVRRDRAGDRRWGRRASPGRPSPIRSWATAPPAFGHVVAEALSPASALERKGWDSNPRAGATRPTVFKTPMARCFMPANRSHSGDGGRQHGRVPRGTHPRNNRPAGEARRRASVLCRFAPDRRCPSGWRPKGFQRHGSQPRDRRRRRQLGRGVHRCRPKPVLAQRRRLESGRAGPRLRLGLRRGQQVRDVPRRRPLRAQRSRVIPCRGRTPPGSGAAWPR